MGYDYNIYIGAYLKILVDPKMVKGKPICRNGHHISIGGKYCAECGTSLVWEAKEARRYLWDLLGDNENLTELDAEFNRGPFILAAGNLTDEEAAPTHFDIDQSFNIEIGNSQIHLYKENFAYKYAAEIEELRNQGAEVTVVFGAVGYYY